MPTEHMFKCADCGKQAPLPARRNEVGQPICKPCLQNIMQFLTELQNEKKKTS